jgi:hypothetical protein
MAFVCAERCFRNVLRLHPDLVISGTKVELGENGCTMELVQQLINDLNRKFVFNNIVVKSPVIHA